MTQYTESNHKRPTQATSAKSLAAITAGAVAAALVIMSIGSIVTIISIGASINPGMQQATADLMDTGHVTIMTPNMQTPEATHFQTVKSLTKRNEKSFYIDAVLREDSHQMPTPTAGQPAQPPKLTIKGNHVFA
ncbi:MAG TPA: hypothetical protein VK950_08035 [Methylophilus sp.]|nr:hypothetical protein [Methylophilus sp.]